jgi:hypothetical protein
LGSIKQQFGIFRKTSEANLALKWIEECMGSTKWWIHIIDCAFPIVEDHILDCALEYRRKYDVRHVVLLSDDIVLKIKSMAKVFLHYPLILCSLSNPCQTSAFGLILESK